MLIIGSKGHAVEIFQCLSSYEREQTVFFDNITPDQSADLFGTYPVLRTLADARAYLANIDSRFILGLGGPGLRRRLAKEFRECGGQLTSVIAPTAVLGPFATLGPGLNIMQHTLVSPTATLGEGVLLNAGAAVHHDSIVGEYCEISPGARILGHCRLGQNCWVGAAAVILPSVTVGQDAVIGAGAIVTRSVEAGTTVVGIPARLMS
ncbi:acetyltransferase [Hymenobacter sp. UYCo722]|uniref:acetyltransferase n=1 Tax=Hymenobacter sp. UYCo722 TaxID=3156335 RepID=UPI0033911EC5